MDGGIEAILGELIEMVQATAPTLWAIAQRQVFSRLVVNAVWGGLCILAATSLGLMARYGARQWKGRDRNIYSTGWGWGDAAIITGILAVAAFVVSLLCFNGVVVYSISPDYYAIKVLLELAR